MSAHNLASESEEMYLLSMAMLIEAGETPPIPIPRLAEALGLQPVSVNQMIHALERSGMVAYEPYKGADLTEEGRSRALQVLCRRRLWETFLVWHLGYDAAQAEELACKLEHATPPDVAARLATFLDNPSLSPQGRPIPLCGEADEPQSRGVSLAETRAGARVEILSLPTEGAEGSFLKEAGLHPGTRIDILAIETAGGCLIETQRENRVHLTPALSREIVVEPVDEPRKGEADPQAPKIPVHRRKK